VLRALSHTLTAGLRRTDVVGRYGGEEFGVILLDTQPHLSRSVLDRIRGRFAELRFESEGRSFSVSFSAGLASSIEFPSSEQLIDAADQLLYRAKANGRNLIAVADNN
jgi:diguanylate cyclase (GGDEF)-like protein